MRPRQKIESEAKEMLQDIPSDSSKLLAISAVSYLLLEVLLDVREQNKKIIKQLEAIDIALYKINLS